MAAQEGKASMRKIEVRHTILTILDPIKGALPEPTLYSFLNLRIRPSVDESEFEEFLGWLSREGFIASLEHNLDPDLHLWFIKERGKVALRT